MAGHSKWSKVKRIKEVVDAKRGKIFSKLSKEITVAARAGGGNIEMNYRLRSLIQAARNQNMPNENIERAIQKGTGELESVQYEEIVYEGYGPGGSAFIVEAATDNRNRTAANMRAIFTKNHGHLAASGSVTYLFSRKGEIATYPTNKSEEEMLDIVLEAGGEELIAQDDGCYTIFAEPEQLYTVAENVKQRGVEIELQQLVYCANNTIHLLETEEINQALRLYEFLEDEDDALNVYVNFDTPSTVNQAATLH